MMDKSNSASMSEFALRFDRRKEKSEVNENPASNNDKRVGWNTIHPTTVHIVIEAHMTRSMSPCDFGRSTVAGRTSITTCSAQIALPENIREKSALTASLTFSMTIRDRLPEDPFKPSARGLVPRLAASSRLS